MHTALNFPRRNFEKFALFSLLFGMTDSNERVKASEAVAGQPLAGDLRPANNQFAIDFLQNIEAHQPGENQVVSPISIESALLMTMEGARHQTADQMGDALALPVKLKRPGQPSPWALAAIRNDMKALLRQLSHEDSAAEQKARTQLAGLRKELDKVNDQANQLMQAGKFAEANKLAQKSNALADQINQLASTIDQYELKIANGIWTETTYPIASEFAETIASDYQAAIQNVDFKKAADKQRLQINQWISKHTQQKINDLLPPGSIDAMTRMVLANAIYFRGTWQEPFNESQTEDKDFFNQGTNKVHVSMMSKWCSTSRYAAFNSDGSPFATPRMLAEGTAPSRGYPTDGFQVVELAYNGGDLSMFVVLPMQPTGLAALIGSLTSEQVDQWEQTLAVRNFELQLPRFKLEVTYDLNRALNQLGMKAAFDANSADFTGMGSEGLFISRVLHKAFIEVNEKGTEAAAATAVVMAVTAAPAREIPFNPQFIADHPFLFLIKHRPSGLTLFVGKVESL